MSDLPNPDNVDYLDEDVLTVPGQNYALVSFVSPQGNQKNDKFGLKIRGCFLNKDEADAHAKRLQKMDGRFDVFLVDMYKWLLIPPDPVAIDHAEYQEPFLNDMLKKYHENQLAAKQHFAERKAAVMEDSLDKHLLPSERITPIAEEAIAETAAIEDAGPSGSSA